MQDAETRLLRIAKIEVVMAWGDSQQGDWRNVRGGAGSLAARQMHTLCIALTLQQRGQLQRVTLGVSQAFAAAA